MDQLNKFIRGHDRIDVVYLYTPLSYMIMSSPNMCGHLAYRVRTIVLTVRPIHNKRSYLVIMHIFCQDTISYNNGTCVDTHVGFSLSKTLMPSESVFR